MRFSVVALFFTVTTVLAMPAALKVDKRAIECPSTAAANTACTAGRPAFSCNGSYVCILTRGGPER